MNIDAKRIGGSIVLMVATVFAAGGRGALEPAESIYGDTGVKGGLVVHLGCGDGGYTTTLRVNDRYLVQGLDTDEEQVAAARKRIRSKKLTGPVSAAVFDGEKLPYVDNTVNLLIAESQGEVSDAEFERVLAPEGVAWIDGEKTVKPRPGEIDEWTHFLHDSGGNAVAEDKKVASPKSLRWVTEPLYSRSHEMPTSVQSVVSADGRIFSILDEGPAGVFEGLPWDCKLIARDAFNGKLLWKRELEKWDSKYGAGKGDRYAMHHTLARRLIAKGNRVYATLRFQNSPVTVLDAASGETVSEEFGGVKGVDEMVLHNDILVVKATSDKSPSAWERLNFNKLENTLVAIDAHTGERLWKTAGANVAPYGLAAQDERVVYFNLNELVCLDINNGRELWRRPCEIRSIRFGEINLVAHSGKVLLTAGKGSSNKLEVFSLKDGKKQWDHDSFQPLSGAAVQPVEIFVINGVVWPGASTKGFDLQTGEVAQKTDLHKLISPGHHRRCIRGKATTDYIIRNKRGAEFVDLSGKNDHMRNDWLRTPCFTGGMPANGLFYKPPDQCFCYPGVKVLGYMALSSDSEDQIQPSDADALVKGAAYGAVAEKAKATQKDWPMYRRDNLRSGWSKKSVPTNLKQEWEADLRGEATQPVVVGDRLWVAEKNAHTIRCLDTETGGNIWSYTAGGRIDSAPTFHAGMLFFGCRDGAVYCLRATDGELVWKFRAAPRSHKLVSFDQLESVWPVQGSVLVQNDRVYFAAGRSSFLNGGIIVYGLNAATGEVECDHRLAGPWPDIRKDQGRPFAMEGALPDLLVADQDSNLYMMRIKFDLDLKRQQVKHRSDAGELEMGGNHLLATGGFLEDTGFDRTYWMHGNEWPGFHFAQHASKSGQIMVFDDKATYAVKYFYRRHQWSPKFFPEKRGYLLFSNDIDSQPGFEKDPKLKWLPKEAYTDKHRRGGRGVDKGTGYVAKKPPRWKDYIPVRGRAMVLAGDKLIVAGPPDKILPDDPLATFEGRDGAELLFFSAQTGKKLNSIDLASPPVFDGMSVANGRLFIARKDGRLVCLSDTSDKE